MGFLQPDGQIEFEHAVLNHFCSKCAQGAVLSEHLKRSTCERELTGVGFCLSFSVEPEVRRLPTRRPFEGASFESDQIPGGGTLLLWVDDQGLLESLECACFADPWPQDYVSLRSIASDKQNLVN